MTTTENTRWILDREVLLSRAGEGGLVAFEIHATQAGYQGVTETFVEAMYQRAADADRARPESAITMMQQARYAAKCAAPETHVRADRLYAWPTIGA